MTDYGNHRFETSGTCSACGVTEEALQDNVASKWCTNYQPTPWGHAGMWLHWTAILFLVGTPLAGLVAPVPGFGQGVLTVFIGAMAMAFAQLHAGVWDEFMDDLSGYEDERTAFLEGEWR